jgi:alpha-mannosidase
MSIDRIFQERHTADHWAGERLTAQAEFVRRLGSRGATGGEAAAGRAEATFTSALARGAAAVDALGEAEAHLLPFAAQAKSYEVTCIGHAHIDMNWQWGYHETVACGAASFTTLLRLLDEFPDMTFLQSQAALYEMMRRHHPALFARMRGAIASGRWEVVAGQWVEAERNCLGGEGFIHQALLARAWCAEHLGLQPDAVGVDWVPDCFGHAASLPGLLAQAGFRHTYACRTGATGRPAAFRWQGVDGREVVMWREMAWYNGAPRLDAAKFLFDIEDLTGLKSWLNVLGIGDHGGGPTRRHIRRVADLDSWPVFPRWRWGRLDGFLAKLDAVHARLPVHVGELNTEYSGCLTSQSQIKRGNRRGEAACAEAEVAAALAGAITGHPVDQGQLREAWRHVCFGHFHDILPGSGVRATREHHAATMQEVLALTTAVASDALRTIAARIDTAWVGSAPGDHPVALHGSSRLGGGAGFQAGTLDGSCPVDTWPAAAVWFNPVAQARDEVATLRVWEGEADMAKVQDLRLRQADGTLLPTQRLGDGWYWGHRYVDLAVPVRIGALGWTALAVEPGCGPAPAVPAVASVADEGGRGHPPWVNRPSGPVTLSNGRLHVSFDRRSGMPCSIVRDGVETLSAPIQLVVVDERPYAMSSWIIGDPMAERAPLCDGFEIALPGPVRAAFRARLRWGDTTATAVWTLDAGSDRLLLRIESRWLMTGSMASGVPRLVLRLPTRLGDAVLTHEIPHGALARREEPGRPMPTLRWLRADGASGSLLVANDGVHAQSIDHGTIALDLLRASCDPDPLPEIGDHAWEFSLRPGAPADDADSRRDGLALAHPLRALLDRAHPGDLPAASGDLAAACDGVAVAALKPAEDGHGLIVRLLNCSDAAAPASLRLHPLLQRSATPCDLLERPTAAGPLAGRSVATLRLA